MPHEPWTVDQELSRLGESIKAQQQDPDTNSDSGRTADNPLRQHIRGGRNMQLGGDLTPLSARPVDPNHPDAIRCPRCRHLTYRRSDRCTQCHFNLSDYRIERAKRKMRRRLSTVMAAGGMPDLLLLLVGTLGLYLVWIGGALASLRRERI